MLILSQSLRYGKELQELCNYEGDIIIYIFVCAFHWANKDYIICLLLQASATSLLMPVRSSI